MLRTEAVGPAPVRRRVGVGPESGGRPGRDEPVDHSIVLVDGTNVLIRSFFAHRDLTSPSGAPTGATYGVANRVREAVALFRPGRVVVFWDGGRSAWRRAVFAGYKDRPPSDRAPDLADCFAQLPTVRALLADLGVDQVRLDGVEADDLIAYAVLEEKFAPVRPRGAVILSTDRDYYQLVSDDVSVYYGASSDSKPRNVTLATFAEATGKSSPTEWWAYRIVNGDASDRIPGVRGLSGEKRWELVWPVLRSMGCRCGDWDFFFLDDAALAVDGDALAEYGPAERKRMAALEIAVHESWPLLERNATLMDMRFAVSMLPAAFRQHRDPDGVAREVECGRWDARAAERTCGRLNFQEALREWTDWVRTFGEFWARRIAAGGDR